MSVLEERQVNKGNTIGDRRDHAHAAARSPIWRQWDRLAVSLAD